MILTDTDRYIAGYPLGDIMDGYIECALWAGLDYTDMTDENPRPLDEVYGRDDIDAESMTLIEADVLTFARRAWYIAEENGWDAGQFGHDYFLTRNGHGSGFWAREWAESVGRHLSDLAKDMGEWELYAGPDGKVYAS